ncbi:DUF3159 domain-containing protein [Leucobacter sp. USCH14]|uniref:DUF3159 domain-containing protein n=1 Tax=Leucobacter sp. USCH14 TaxID=3024838 RepID=UPI0030993D8D
MSVNDDAADGRRGEAPQHRTPLTPPAPTPGPDADEAKAAGPLGGSLGRTVRAGMSGETLTGRGVLDALGGWRGVAETLVPGLLFLIIFTFTRDARTSAIAPAAITVVAVIVRLVRREPLVSVFSGAAGVAIAVVATLFTGRGADYYVPGFITNILWSAGLLISAAVGWPLIGIALGALRGDLTGWRRDRTLKRVAMWLTLLWSGLFIARLAVQVPLYFAAREPDGVAATDALGIARLVMGVPLFALVVVFTWMVLSRLPRSSDDSEGESVANTGQNTSQA